MVVNSSGFAAWHVRDYPYSGSSNADAAPAPCVLPRPCAGDHIYALGDQGLVLVDSVPGSSVASLTNVNLDGDTLTWTHDGSPEEFTLT
jgi:hypothetical protein